jgi:hypothetical protein
VEKRAFTLCAMTRVQLRISGFILTATVTLFAAPLDLRPLRAGQTVKESSAFKGDAVVHKLDGQAVAPTDAQVWIIFGSSVLYEGMPNRGDYIDSAALQFENQLASILAKDKKVAKSHVQSKDSTIGQTKEDINLGRGYMFQAEGQALEATREWVQKQPKKGWQVRIIAPEADGKWFVGGLAPGIYNIFVRADFGRYDAEWKAEMNVKPNQTLVMPQAPSLIYEKPI